MKIDWIQLGQDFQQKYQGTFCRYTSPVSKNKEVFHISSVMPQNFEGPHLVLFNKKAGELHLNFCTEAELDFTFPECNYFEHDMKCFQFNKVFQRQWKKGVCDSTAKIVFPYNSIYKVMPVIHIDEDIMNDVFRIKKVRSIKEGIFIIENDGYFSVPLNDVLSLGVSENKSDLWIWYKTNLVGSLIKSGTGVRQIHLWVPEFQQELEDFLRQTHDHARAIVQASP